MIEFLKRCGKICLLLIVLSLIYILLLTIVFIPSNQRIQNHIDTSAPALPNEYPIIYANEEMQIALDSYTDGLMISHSPVKPDGASPLQASMVDYYSRYWHGYLLLIRPLLMIMSYQVIQYFNIFIVFLLVFLSGYFISKALSVKYAVAYIVTLSMCAIFILPLSLQYSNMFHLMMIFTIIICFMHNKLENIKKCPFFLCCLFAFFGSLTNFFDFLTTPLIVLGIPLAITILIISKRNKNTLLTVRITVACSFYWGISYALTWVLKWLWYIIISGQSSSIQDVINTILFRMKGDDVFLLDRRQMYRDNFNMMFPSYAKKAAVVFIFIIGVLLIFYHKKWKDIYPFLPVGILAFYPYIWYFVLGNHSQIHYGFTYRTQAISIFVVLAVLFYCLDSEHILKDIRRGRGWLKSKLQYRKTQKLK